MIGIYFSGTGNTKYCVERLVKYIDGTAAVLPLEGTAAPTAIAKTNVIVFGYCVQYADAPYFVKEFIIKNKRIWKGKNIFCVATMGGARGDSTWRTARLFKRYGAHVLGAMQIRMPDNVCDYKEKKEDVPPSLEKLYLEEVKHESDLKKRAEENRKLIKAANERILETVKDFKIGKYPKDGLGFGARVKGFFGQHLWHGNYTKGYNDLIKVNEDVCDGCRICIEQCPMHNFTLEDGKAHTNGKCTACYRCVNKCPKKAITLSGDKVGEQYRIEKFY